jgi:hypothetical protein
MGFAGDLHGIYLGFMRDLCGICKGLAGNNCNFLRVAKNNIEIHPKKDPK